MNNRHVAGVIRLSLMLAAGLAFLSLTALPVSAGAIAVLVNDAPITNYDVNQRAKLINVTTRRPMAAAKKSALKELIDEKLKTLEARRLGVSANPDEVNRAFGAIASRVKMTPSQLSNALVQLGVNAQTLRNRIEADIVWQQVIRQRFRQEVRVRDSDVERALAKREDDPTAASIEMRLQQIMFIVPKGSSNTYKSQRKSDAQEYRSRFNGCNNSRALAKEYRDVFVKDLGIRNLSELPQVRKEALEEVAVGNTTPPAETANAYELVAVCDRKEVQDQTAARREAEAQLMNEQGNRLSRRLLIDLKQSAVIEYR